MANRFLNNIRINDEYTFPENDGSAGQAIVTDGSGNLSFGSAVASSADSTESVHINVKNTSGSQILKGTPVYVTGETGNSGKIEIAPADASDSAKMPALGILESTLNDNTEGFCVQGGLLEGLATATIDGTSTTANDTVYVKAGGGLTMTKPTGSDLIQNIAKIARVHASNGSLVVSSILRTNDVPNLTTGKIWVGTANNTAESGVVHLDETNGRIGIGTPSPVAKLHIQNGSSGQSTPNAIANGLVIETGSSTAAGLSILSPSTTAGNIFFGDESDNYVGGFRYYHNINEMSVNVNNAEAIRIDSSRNVGIGATSPGAKLDVVGTARFNEQLATNNTAGAAKAFIHVSSGSGAAKFKVYKNVNTTDGYAHFVIDRSYDYGSNDQMIQEIVYQRRGTTKNVKFKYDGDTSTSDDVYLEFYELTDGTVEAWVCHDDFAQVGVSITYFTNTGNTYPTPSAETPTGTLIHSTNPDTETPNWDTYQGSGYFSGNVGIGTASPGQKLQVEGNSWIKGIYYDTSGDAGTSGQVLSSTATGTTWITLNDIYYTETESDSRFVNVTGDTMTGDLSFGSQTGTWISSNAMSDAIGWNNNYGVYIGSDIGGTHYLRANGTFTTGGNTYDLWHAGNDGSGSGLDADLLDGQQGTHYLDYNNFTNTPTIPSAYNHPTYTGDDINLDTGALAGAIVISDLDFNITTDTLGHVTDANATYSVRSLTAANIGAAASSHTHSASDITSGTLATARLPEFIEERYIYNSDDSIGVFMPMVKGGMYATNSSSVTGAIKVTLPSYKSSMMFTIYVDIYEYTTGETVTFRVSGYAYGDSGATWHNCSVVNLADNTDRNYTVRFYSDTTVNAQYFTIGESDSTWSYPQVNLRDFWGGYSTSESDALGEWNVEFVTNLTGVLRHTFTDNFVAADWDGIRDKPSTFPPSSHNHDSDYVNVTGDTMTGTLTVPNLTIGSGNKIQFANNDYIRYDDANGVGRFHFDADGGTNNASVQAATFVGALSTTGISGSNYNITGVNQLEINDPGEGIIWRNGSSGDILLAVVDDSSDNILRLSGTGATLQVGTNRVLTTADEGSGNGLDADLLDGQQGTHYLDYNNFTNTPTIPSAYNHPTHPGDDINLDTGALTGATVISDLDFNVTTDTLGHVTDANATYSTRNLTASDLGIASTELVKNYQNQNYIASGGTTGDYRDNYGTGVTVYEGYSSGSDRPHTYDATVQFMPTSAQGFELSASWISSSTTPLKIRSLRDCCQGWSSWVDVAVSGATSSGIFQTTGDYRAPRFYDYNDTAYYVDPSSTSVLNILNLAGDLTVGGGDITLSGTGRIQGIDTVSVGTDAANKTYVDNYVDNAVSGLVDGSGTANYVAKWSDTDTLTNSGIVETSTLTTINNASFEYDYSGTTYLNIDGTTGTFLLGQHSTTDRVYIHGIQNAIKFYVDNVKAGEFTDDQDFLVTNGNVGIGTTNPSGLLHVSSSTSGDAVVIIESDTDNNAENDNPQLQFKQDGGLTIAKAGLTGDAGQIFGNSLGNAAYFGNDESASVQFYTNATAALTIREDGDVGIGTTNPVEALDVNGSIKSNATIWTGYDSGVVGSVSCSGWFRSNGSTGWFNASYGGGIYMTDSTWVRVYNNKKFYNQNTIESNTAMYAPVFYDRNNTAYRFHGDQSNNSVDLLSSGNYAIHVAGTIGGGHRKHNNLETPEMQWSVGGGTDLNWKKLCDIVVSDANYSGWGAEIEITDFSGNYGNAAYNGGELYKGALSIYHWGGSGDNTETPYANIPYALRNNVRWYKINESGQNRYQLQVKSPGDYRQLYIKVKPGIGNQIADVISYANDTDGATTGGTAYISIQNADFNHEFAGDIWTNDSRSIGFRNGYGSPHFSTYYGSLTTSASVYIGGPVGNGQDLYCDDLRSNKVFDRAATAYYFEGGNSGDSIRVAGDVVAYYSSDKRLKDNIKPIDNALDKVNAISGVTFEWNEKSHKTTGRKDVGVVAQEVEEVFPEIVETRSNGYKAVDYQKLTAVLIESVKELSAKVEALEAKQCNCK